MEHQEGSSAKVEQKAPTHDFQECYKIISENEGLKILDVFEVCNATGFVIDNFV